MSWIFFVVVVVDDVGRSEEGEKSGSHTTLEVFGLLLVASLHALHQLKQKCLFRLDLSYSKMWYSFYEVLYFKCAAGTSRSGPISILLNATRFGLTYP
jgi:hypothetical protein